MTEKNTRIIRHARGLLPTLVASIGSAGLCTQAMALGLGGASTTSRIGGPLRVEIQIQAEDAERIDPACLKLAPPPASYNEELPWLSKARLSIEKRGDRRFLLISTPGNNHPALMLGIQIACGMEFRRDYTLLINPPEASTEPEAAPAPQLIQSSPVTAPSAGTPPRVSPNNTQLTTAEGDTARSIANRLYPDDTQAQRRMARAILAANASRLNGRSGTYDRLPAGIALDIPPLSAEVPVLSPDKPASPTTLAPSPKPATVATTRKGRDRLLVSGAGTDDALRLSTSIGQRRELNEDQRSRLRTEMQLIATLDEKIATQLELADRLRQLEALQTRLKDDADRLEKELRTQQAAQQSAPAENVSAPVSLPLAAPKEVLVPAKASQTTAHQTPWAWIAAISGIAVLAAFSSLWLWRKRRSQSPLDGDTLPLHGGNETGVAEHLIDPISEADIWPDEEGHAPRANPRLAASIEGALGPLSVSGLGPASMLQIVEDDVEEHDSAVELAEIMMSFGRVQGAAQTLADFIRANPKQAVKPWIKLLEVYRAADMRTEFDALTSQLNKTFNVRTVTWEDFEIARQAPESLESMPHIMAQLHEHWGKRDCQKLLHELLRDNRQGTRQGFPLAIVDEILLLLGILESQIGPYRPDSVEHTPTHIQNPTLNPRTTQLAPPLVVESTETVPAAPVVKAAQSAPPAAATSSSLDQLDFELDMTDLSKTLHINLDELGSENGSFSDTNP